MLHVTWDTWHMQGHMWHVTSDMSHVTHNGGWINQLLNHKPVYRTAPATTGLLKSSKILLFIAQTQSWKEKKNVCRQTLVSQRISIEDRAHEQSKGNLLIKNYCNIRGYWLFYIITWQLVCWDNKETLQQTPFQKPWLYKFYWKPFVKDFRYLLVVYHY